MIEYSFPIRKIIHIDMDAFYASVEQKDNINLKGKAIAVGGSSNRGVVCAASYEARKFGVHSALSSKIALQRCPNLIFIKPRFERYREISNQIRDIFIRYSDKIEPLSLDEAFIDVTNNLKNINSASKIALEIRKQIFIETGLTASAGISINKFTAKIASDLKKPNGQVTIGPDEILPFLENLPIENFFGVGKVTAKKMKNLGIMKGIDLKEKDIEFLYNKFGKSGTHYFNIVRGIQNSEVRNDRKRKSLGAELTFINDLIIISELIEKISAISSEVASRLNKNKTRGRTITLKIKYNDFSTQTRSKTINDYLYLKKDIFFYACKLLNQDKVIKPIRLLGITISNLFNNSNQKPVQLEIPFNYLSKFD